MDDEYFKQQADRIREMAGKADPFTKKRLLDLAERYDARLGRPSRASRQLRLPDMIENASPPGSTPGQSGGQRT